MTSSPHTSARGTPGRFKVPASSVVPPDARTHIGHYIAPGGGAPTANSIVIMSHLDVTPNVLPQLLDIMKPLSEGSAKDAGMQTYQILRQAPGTGNHFRLFEIWASERAFDAHNLAARSLFEIDVDIRMG